MANYNVDIAVAVKNLNAIKALKRELDAVQKSLDAVKKASKLDAGDESGFRKRRKQRNEEKQALLDQKRLTAELKRAEAGRRAELIKAYREQRQQELSLKRIAEQRMKGLGQYAVSIGPQPDRTAELRKKQQQVRLEAAKNANFQTKFELQLAQQLLGTGKKQLNIKQQITDQQQRQIKNAQALNAQRDKALKKEQKELDIQRKKEQRMRKKRINAAVTGGAFPLLFGGGPLQALGGAIGGGISGEMFSGLTVGLQVVGSAVDSFFTTVKESADRVSAALDGTSASLEAVKETGVAVQSSTVEYIQQLEESGRSLDAYNAVQRELNSIYGVEGKTVLQELKAANEFANTEAGKLAAVLQAELAPVFILLAQLGGGAARGIREIVPAIADALGEFTLGIPGATTTAQLSRKLPGSDPALIAAGERQRAGELRTDAQIETITAGTEALRRQAQIVQLNNDLTDERVVALRKAEITIKAQNKITALSAKATKDIFNTDFQRLTQAEIQKVKQQEILDLAKLEVSAREAIAAKAKKTAAEQERAARAAQRAADKAEEARMKELQDRIDIASRERQKELDLEASFQDRLKSIGDQNALLRGQLEGDEDRVRKELQINNLVDKFGEEKRGQIELLINERYQLKEQISLLTEQERLYAQIGQTIQSGIVSGIQGAIDGSKSLAESLSGVLKQLGGMFLNVGIGALGQSMGIPGFKPFAQGGYVSGPTTALVGEGGQGEYVIPENKMRESMARYSRGARGSSVIPDSGVSGTSGEGGGTAVAAPIDVRFNVERINNVDYVTASEFQAGMQQAAAQGAQRGQQAALKRLQQSPSTRRRVGI